MYNSSTIISLNVHNISFKRSLAEITQWGLENRSGFVCFANVHMTIEAYKSFHFKQMLRNALLVLPDGKPLALACKWLHNKRQERISGMDFLPALLEESDKNNARIFLYGSTEAVLDRLTYHIKTAYPNIIIVGAISPPFRKMSQEETDVHIADINKSNANFVLVALGCPKQEIWMAENYSKINAILLGVGGAFPVVAGVQKRSPKIMQNISMEWLFRLSQEPKRLIRRYTYTNMFFIALLSVALIRKNRIQRRLLMHTSSRI
jgi:N-acetylglucosaminyldiphosphoundecaprenol N-acetyl-beta-D-mannosaminyltransferase